MARISPARLNPESRWHRFHPVGSSTAFHGCWIGKQGDASVSSEQPGVAVDEPIEARSRDTLGSAPEEGLRRKWITPLHI
jgi:hypothetical protein